MSIEIDKHVPIPVFAGNTKYPFDKMEVGDSFYIGPARKDSASAASWYHGKKYGKKFCTRSEGDGIRIWRLK